MNNVTEVLLVLVAALLVAVSVLLVRTRRISFAQKTALASATRFRQIMDRAPVILWTARPDTTLDYVNQTAHEYTGVPICNLLDEGWLDAAHPEDRQNCMDIYMPAVAARQPFFMEYRLRWADGAYRWVVDTGVPYFEEDGTYLGYVGCAVDTSSLKLAEELVLAGRDRIDASHKEIQQLAGRLITAQEDERRYLARELHDDLTQRLARVAIEVGQLELAGTVEGGALSTIRADLVRMSEDVHALSYRLHPSVLDDLGLVEALHTECDRVSQQGQLRVDVAARDIPDDMAREASLCLFRIAQEALSNVARHAKASQVSVMLAESGCGMRLAVSDNGSGFDPQGERDHPSLGLASMRERVRLVSGELDIKSTPGHGTTIVAWVPV